MTDTPSPKPPTCRKCGSPMAPGIALANTMTGTGDFGRDDVVTMSPGGPGKLIDCDKCTACGWSVSPKTPSCDLCDDEGWVCENHLDKAWPDQCDCGAGCPCVCNPGAGQPEGFVTTATTNPDDVKEWQQ